MGTPGHASLAHCFVSSVTHLALPRLTVPSGAPIGASVGQASCLSFTDRQDACPTKMDGEVDLSATSGDTGAGIRHRIHENLNLALLFDSSELDFLSKSRRSETRTSLGSTLQGVSCGRRTRFAESASLLPFPATEVLG